MACTSLPTFRPHEFFPLKPQENYPCMEDDYDDQNSDDSSVGYYSCSDCSLGQPVSYKLPHEFFPPNPQEFNHSMDDNHLPYPWDDPKSYCNEQLSNHSSYYDSDIETEPRYNLYSPCDSSMVAEGASNPSLYSYESDPDSNDSLFSLPSLLSCPVPATPANEPESNYGPFSPRNSPTAATSPFHCNRCYEMARAPVVTSCGHLYCSACLYEWLCFEHGRECVVCMANLYGGSITPILSGVN